MEYETDVYIFHSGKKIYANNGIIGLNPKADLISGGYSDVFNADRSDFTKEEIIEISDYMIAQWEKFKKVDK